MIILVIEKLTFKRHLLTLYIFEVLQKKKGKFRYPVITRTHCLKQEIEYLLVTFIGKFFLLKISDILFLNAGFLKQEWYRYCRENFYLFWKRRESTLLQREKCLFFFRPFQKHIASEEKGSVHSANIVVLDVFLTFGKNKQLAVPTPKWKMLGFTVD